MPSRERAPSRSTDGDRCPSCGQAGNPDVADHDRADEHDFGRTFYCDNWRCRVTVFTERDLTWMEREAEKEASAL